MSESLSKRETIRAHVADARAQLAEIARHTEDQLAALRVTPEWNGLDMLRHILFWNDTVLQSLADWAGSKKIESAQEFDTLNHSEVLVRAALGRDALVAQLHAAYDTYEALLVSGSDAELNEPGIAAWGEQTTRLGLIGIVGHDEEHYAQIRAAAGL